MADLLLDIVTYFTSNGLVQGDGIDAFRDVAPDAPDNIVVAYEYQGNGGMPQVDGVVRKVQICARNKRAVASKQKAIDLYKALMTDDGIMKFTEQRWGVVSLLNTPFKIKVDLQARVYYGFNLSIITYND